MCTSVPYPEKVLQGCSLFQNNCSFLFEVSSFVIIAWQMFSHMAIGQPRSRRHQHDLNIASQHLHFICKEERDSEVRRGIVNCDHSNLEYLNKTIFFLFRSSSGIIMFVKQWQHLSVVNLPGWQHRWLHIDKTYRVEISPKIQAVCTCRLFTVVINGIIKRILCHKKA